MKLREALERVPAATAAEEKLRAKRNELWDRHQSALAELDEAKEAVTKAAASFQLREGTESALIAARKKRDELDETVDGLQAALEVLDRRVKQAERDEEIAKREVLALARSVAAPAAERELEHVRKLAHDFSRALSHWLEVDALARGGMRSGDAQAQHTAVQSIFRQNGCSGTVLAEASDTRSLLMLGALRELAGAEGQ